MNNWNDNLPKRTKEHVKNDLARNKFRQLFTDPFFIIREETDNDYGVDICIEALTNNGESPTNIRAYIQLKSSSKDENTTGSYSYSVSTSNLHYLLNNTGSIYVLYSVENDIFYYCTADKVFNYYNSKGDVWKVQKSITVHFEQVLDDSELNRIHENMIAVALKSKENRLNMNTLGIKPRVFDITSYILQKPIYINNNSYTILKLIGSGGLSEVFIAEDDMGHKICLKFLNPRTEIGLTDSIKERFRIEYMTLKSLTSDKVVEVYDTSVFENFEYYSMEYYSDGNLKNFLRNNRININEKFNVFINICDCLNYIQSKGVHRDLKPDNILIKSTTPFQIVLSDFGTYFNLEDLYANTETRKEDKLGSLVYIPPAQRNQSIKSPYLDIYALGIIFYQILIDDTFELRLKPLTFVKGLEPIEIHLIQNIIYKMCNNNWEDSYKNVNDILIDLYNKILIRSNKFSDVILPTWLLQDNDSFTEFTSSNIYHTKKIKLEIYNELKWNYEIETNKKNYTLSEALIFNNFVFYASYNGDVICLTLETGKLIWKTKCSQYSFMSTPVIKDSELFCVDTQGVLYCIYLEDGGILWSLDALEKEKKEQERYLNNPSDKEYCTCPLKIINETIVIVSNGEQIKFINKNTKKMIDGPYTFIPYRSFFRPTINEIIEDNGCLFINLFDEVIGFINTSFDNLYVKTTWCLKIENLKVNKDSIFTGLAYDSQSIFISTNCGKILCLNSMNGEKKWVIDIGKDITSPITVDDDFLVFNSIDGYLYIIYKSNGLTYKSVRIDRRRRTHYDEDMYYFKPIISNGKILVLTDYSLRIFDADNLMVLVEHEIGEHVSYPTFANNELLIVSTMGISAFSHNLK